MGSVVRALPLHKIFQNNVVAFTCRTYAVLKHGLDHFVVVRCPDLLESVLEKHRHLVAATPPPSPTQQAKNSRHSTLLLFSSSPIRSGNLKICNFCPVLKLCPQPLVLHLPSLNSSCLPAFPLSVLSFSLFCCPNRGLKWLKQWTVIACCSPLCTSECIFRENAGWMPSKNKHLLPVPDLPTVTSCRKD